MGGWVGGWGGYTDVIHGRGRGVIVAHLGKSMVSHSSLSRYFNADRSIPDMFDIGMF